jgi:hypothetical protein
VIITDSLCTIMAAKSRTPTKNPKTQTIRKMLDQEGPRITFLHKGIPDNKKADQTAKEAPDDLKKWLTEENFKNREQRWKNGNNEMKETKLDVDRKKDTKRMLRKEQVAISRLRTGYMEGVGNPLYPFCNTYLSFDHILWECKETEDQRTNMDMNIEQ